MVCASSSPLQGMAVWLHVAYLIWVVMAGIPVTSCREIRVLQACRHPNIVHLKKVVTGSKPDRQGCQPSPCFLNRDHVFQAVPVNLHVLALQDVLYGRHAGV